MNTPSVEAPTTSAPEWAAPEVECCEIRPEVTAYAGTGEPWATR